MAAVKKKKYHNIKAGHMENTNIHSHVIVVPCGWMIGIPTMEFLQHLLQGVVAAIAVQTQLNYSISNIFENSSFQCETGGQSASATNPESTFSSISIFFASESPKN